MAGGVGQQGGEGFLLGLGGEDAAFVFLFAFAGGGEGGLDVGIDVKKEVGAPKRDAVHNDDTPRDVVPTERLLLFDIRPLWPARGLMSLHPPAELIVPHARRGHINRTSGQR